VGAVYDAAFGTYQPCVNAASCATKYFTTQCTGWYAIDNTVADMVTSYSNTASFLTVLAPSNQCYTTDIISSGGYSSGDYYDSFGGTSAACPYAAGAVACLQSAAKAVGGSYLSPSEVRTILTSTGDSITDGKVNITKPRVNLGQAIDHVMSIYVDAGWTGPENGNIENPYNTLSEGVSAVPVGGFLWIKAGTYTGPDNVPITFDKAMTVRSYEGTATIGQ
jgi:subtilisin family serine protease